jgi:hypothetical protein
MICQTNYSYESCHVLSEPLTFNWKGDNIVKIKLKEK